MFAPALTQTEEKEQQLKQAKRNNQRGRKINVRGRPCPRKTSGVTGCPDSFKCLCNSTTSVMQRAVRRPPTSWFGDRKGIAAPSFFKCGLAIADKTGRRTNMSRAILDTQQAGSWTQTRKPRLNMLARLNSPPRIIYLPLAQVGPPSAQPLAEVA